MYTAVSPYGPLLALAKTTDFKSFERIALVSEPENKDGVLFPEKINGKYARLDRPVAGGLGNIWISYSDDLISDGLCNYRIRPPCCRPRAHRQLAMLGPLRTGK